MSEYDSLNSSETSKNEADGKAKGVLYPAVPMYGPHNIKNLEVGEKKLWCACGLSKNQPWCDGSHVGTGLKPLKWTVTKSQVLHQVCGCKYTRSPPYCDATHTYLPCEVLQRQESCRQRADHCSDKKLCTGCGWVPDF